MEPLWSPAVAIGGNQWQMDRDAQPLKQAKTVAVGCDRLPESFHGKEGVDGSSPSEGSTKAPQIRPFRLARTCRSSSMRSLGSPLWSLQDQRARSKASEMGAFAGRASSSKA
jgi:hypothetical protein